MKSMPNGLRVADLEKSVDWKTLDRIQVKTQIARKVSRIEITFPGEYPTTQIVITYTSGVRHFCELLPDGRMQFVRDAGRTLDGIKDINGQETSAQVSSPQPLIIYVCDFFPLWRGPGLCLIHHKLAGRDVGLNPRQQ